MNRRFHTTHWSLVLAARTGQSPESRIALEELCNAYWFPLYAFVRRQGYGAEESRDLTQSYFARLLERKDLQQVRPELGHFRSFLLASLKHFLSNELDRERAKKRDPGSPLLSLDAQDAEGRYRFEPADDLTPEVLFERKWALTVLDRSSARLRDEWNDAESKRRFEALQVYVTGDADSPSYREVGESLGMSEGAVRVAVHRLRRRFGEVLREEVGDTVLDPSDVEDEIRDLVRALRR